ncbi:tyrosine-type recombinase/integrase [Sneathia sanguinegens]|uniref:tyrosine-type recombinase/integrase n=1 Tax=Sneathia sanguinegens TaxID=40543 RepID=UPI002889E460|nr:tyrosine-type recombinase/integrase [Sneathia sanguinegens]
MASFKLVERENWEVSFYCKDARGNNKKIKKRGFRTKKDASDYATNYIKKHTGDIETPFFDVLDEFLEYRKTRVKFNTFIAYKTFNNVIKSKFENKPISKITSIDIAKLLDTIKYPETQKKIKIKLNLLFKYAKTYYNLKQNIMNDFEYEFIKSPKKEKEIWTLEDFKKFDEILIKEKKIVQRAYFNLLFYSGARPGEIAALTLEDINFEKCTIDINKTRISSKKSNSPKNQSSIRVVTIPRFCAKILEDVIGKNYPKKEYIFKFNSVYNIFLFNKIKKYNLNKITLHGFRHSHASFLIKQGIEITAISKRLGHKNSQITLSTYAHFYNDKKDKIIDLLNELE